MKIAIYTRVSTDKQDTENQALQLREFAAKQGWEIVAEYCDNGISGSKADRAELQRMFHEASHPMELHIAVSPSRTSIPAVSSKTLFWQSWQRWQNRSASNGRSAPKPV